MERFAKQAPPLGAIPRCSSDLPIFVLHLGTPYGISSADKQSRRHRVLPTEDLPYRVHSSGILREVPPARSTPGIRTATWSTRVTRSTCTQVQVRCESLPLIYQTSLVSRASCSYPGSAQRSRFYHALARTLVTRSRVYRMFT